jgi:hypothetical protein
VTRKVAELRIEDGAGDLARGRLVEALRQDFDLREAEGGLEVYER